MVEWIQPLVSKFQILNKGPARWLAILAIAAAPALMGVILVNALIGAPISHYVPSWPNDLPDYWHEAESFRAYGFDTGYYTAYEVPPRTSFTHFGVHGPLFPALQGTFGKIFGWGLDGPIWFNFSVLATALLVFVGLVRPNGQQLALLLLLVVTFWPIHLLTPTAYQESLHHAAAIVIAGLAGAWLQANNEARRRIALALFALVFFMSVLRFSWALLFAPILLLGRKLNAKTLIASFAIGLIPLGIAMWLSGLLAAPGHNVITGFIHLAAERPIQALFALLDLFDFNISNYFDVDPLDLLLRIEILLLSVALPVVLLFARIPSLELTDGQRRLLRSFETEGWLYAYLAGTIYFSSVALYLSNGFFRVFSVTFVLIAFLLLATNRLKAVATIVALHVILSFGLSGSIREWKPNFKGPESLQPYRAFFQERLKYQPPPASPWCNTVLMNHVMFDYRVTQIPAGFGVSTFQPGSPPQDVLRSRFIMLTPKDHMAFKDTARLAPRGVLPDKTLALFENLKSDCSTAPPPGN